MANREHDTALLSVTPEAITAPWQAPDIVTRLRNEACEVPCDESCPTMLQAADEIEALRGQLLRAAEMIRIKDVLINKQIARITHLEARNG